MTDRRVSCLKASAHCTHTQLLIRLLAGLDRADSWFLEFHHFFFKLGNKGKTVSPNCSCASPGKRDFLYHVSHAESGTFCVISVIIPHYNPVRGLLIFLLIGFFSFTGTALGLSTARNGTQAFMQRVRRARGGRGQCGRTLTDSFVLLFSVLCSLGWLRTCCVAEHALKS